MVLWPLLVALTVGSYARVSEVQGDVVVEREGEYQPLTLNFLVEPGDRILAVDGRAELEFRYRTVVWIGKGTDLLVHRIERELREFELREGKVTVLNQDQGQVRVVIPQGEIDLTPDTRIRVHVEEDGDVWVSVLDGKIYVDTDEMRLVARKGEELEIDEFGELAYRSHPWSEDFYTWCDHRYTRYTVRISVTYWEPVTWVGFWDLVPYGEWVWIPPYGWVWVPRVTIGWQPYLYGYWTFRPGIGWVWVSYEPWGWIPYHYGRWAYVPGYGWVWVPGRTFGGAWVAWHVSSNTVAWAPLGPYDRVPTGPNRKSVWIAVTRKSFERPRPSLLVAKADEKRGFPYERVTLERPIRKWSKTPALPVPKIEAPSRIQESLRRIALEKRPFLKPSTQHRGQEIERVKRPKSRSEEAPRIHRSSKAKVGRESPKRPTQIPKDFRVPGVRPKAKSSGDRGIHEERAKIRITRDIKGEPTRSPRATSRTRVRRPSKAEKPSSPAWLRSVNSLGKRLSGLWESDPDHIPPKKKTRKVRQPIDNRNILKDNR